MKKMSNYKRVIAVLIVFISLVAVVRIFKSNNSSNSGSKKIYYALGDAVVTGRGLDPANTSDVCGRTGLSYPNVLATALDISLENMSCSGARVDEGILNEEVQTSGKQKAQLDQMFEKTRPDLISITVGVNSFPLLADFKKCRTENCDISNSAEVLKGLTVQYKTILDKIKAHYDGKQPLTIVTGYYQIIPKTNNGCAELVGFDSTEIASWRQRTKDLNDTISNVAKEYSFVKYVDVDFSDHELCTIQPWLQTFTESAPLLPTALGSQVIAKAVGTVVVNYARSKN